MNAWEIPLEAAGIIAGAVLLAVVLLTLRDVARGARKRLGR